MAESKSTEPLASSAKTEDWRDRWQHQDAWTVREFTQLCCGWNPSVYEFPNRDQYNEALESINRAVRVKVLPTIELSWPATGAERLYDSFPMFRPREVAPWAAKRYPGVFPYSADAWEKDKFASADVGTEPPGDQRYSVEWEDVTIEFTSDHRVQITVKDRRTYTQNYAEMGCEDGRTEKPNKAWEILQLLAESGGVLTAAPDGRWEKIEKRMQEIRKILREHFKRERFDISSDSDPLPYVKGNGYRARFVLGHRPSFDT
jgi:hypothetical protein